MLVNTIMSAPVISVHESTPVGEALDLLRQKNIRHLAVTGDQGKLVGVATEWSLIKIFFGCNTSDRFKTNLISRTPVSSVMDHAPFSVAPNETIEKAALIMEKEKASSIFVEDQGELVGIISLTDILRALIDALGLEKAILRITVKYKRSFGFLADLVKLIDECEVIVENLVTFNDSIVLKVKNQNSELLLNKMKEKGYQVDHIAYLSGSKEELAGP